MEKKTKKGDEQDGQLFVWQGYTGKVELFSFTTFLTRPVRRVALGEDHSLMLTYDDCLFACGRNEYGQLGCSDPQIGEYSFDPCIVEGMSGVGITDIACGPNHSACVTKDGCLYMWGQNLHGQCGFNTQESSILAPRLLELSYPETVCKHGVTSPGAKETACKIACGSSHSVAKTKEGNVWVWGTGPQLGLGDAEKTTKPTVLEMFKGKEILQICCGDFNTALLVKEDAVKQKSPSKGKDDTAKVNEIEGSSETKCDQCRSEKREVDEDVVKSQGDDDARTSYIVDPLDVNVKLAVDVRKHKTVDKETQGQTVSAVEQRKALKSLDFDNDQEQTQKQLKEENGVNKEGNGEKDEKIELDESERKPHPLLDIEETSDKNTEDVLRKKESPKTIEDLLTASVRSDTSVSSNWSTKTCLSGKSMLNEKGAREFLARQFQEEESVTPSDKPDPEAEERTSAHTSVTGAPSSPGAFMMSTMSSLTSTMSTMTTKTISNIASLTGKLGFSSAVGEEDKRSSTETLEKSEISDMETGSFETLNVDRSLLDLSTLDISDTSLNASQSSIPDLEKGPESSVELSPEKIKRDQSPRRLPQSLRTIEAKQENLRKRSLSLLTAEEKHKEEKPSVRYTLHTEVWTWGRNSKGQLGLGDMIDRCKPDCVQVLTGMRIIKLACGSNHTLALSSSGEVYSWGLNENGQLAHNEYTCSPFKIELASDCFVWSLDAGSNHSVFLVDSNSTQGNRPEGFYAGKHPSKDLYVPIYKTNRLTPLKFLKKAGWMCSVFSGGDNCACLSRQETELTCLTFELMRFVWELHKQLQQITQEFVKRFQISGFFTGLDVQPYKNMLTYLLSDFTELTFKFGIVGLEMMDLLNQGESVTRSMLFTHYDSFIAALKKFSHVFEDMVAGGGFEFCAKSGSALFDNLQEFYPELLKMSPGDIKPDHASKFRQLMYTPLMAIKDLSSIVNRFSELYEKSTKENNLLSSVHLNLEHLMRTSMTAISDADNTRMFWESAAPKISESLRRPKRRLIKESRSTPLILTSAGRFSSHVFYLFNDIFIHSQSSSHQSYALETVWIDVPAAEPAAVQQNVITVTTPEEVLVLMTATPQLKVEWVMAFNTAINKVLARQKSVSRQNSEERVQTPVVRLAKHTFSKHPLFREATYRGYWLNGKVHGTGLIKWPDGRKYKGTFSYGSITGSGKMTVPKEKNAEEVLEGKWKDSKLHGHCKIMYSNGDLYEGFMKDGLRHGHGVFRKGRCLSSASFVYVGEWLLDKKHGYGVMDDIIKGEKYMGMWQEDKRHGDGVVVTLDGMYFEGNFQFDKLVGHGLMLTDDNSSYEGEFAGITMLQGKGILTFPGGDKIEGTFSGTWNQGLKITGTFHKNQLSAMAAVKSMSPKSSPERMSSLFGKLCVKPERKWEEIFYQCYDSLAYSGIGEPNTSKAWDQVVACIVAGKQLLRDQDRRQMTSKQKMELSNLEQLETVPTHSASVLSIEHFSYIVQYLHKAFEANAHPLGKLMEDLATVFQSAYIGIGAHPRLLFHAVQEIKSYMKRIHRVIRILFPELPVSGEPSHVYPATMKRASTPIKENMGFLQRQISEYEEGTPVEVVSAAGILQPILLPKIYPALFDLYALHSDREDDKYWERVQKLNKQGDMALMAYLGIDQNFWCMDAAVIKEKKMRISSIKDHSYSKAHDILQQISTAFCPLSKLEIIQKSFNAITESAQESLGEEHIWCMDELFPIFQFVVLRARIHHLGAEIKFIEELMESYLEFGELGIMFTTLKACYFQIQNEKIPIH